MPQGALQSVQHPLNPRLRGRELPLTLHACVLHVQNRPTVWYIIMSEDPDPNFWSEAAGREKSQDGQKRIKTAGGLVVSRLKASMSKSACCMYVSQLQ